MRRLMISLGFSLCLASQSMQSLALPKPQNIYWVILAGGGGTRLWPLSRADEPKQFLSVTDKSLLEQSVDRLRYYPEFDKTHVYISTGLDLAPRIEQMKVNEGLPIEGVIAEPGRRDTGPAILFASLTILRRDPDALIMFLPADPYIPTDDYAQFGSYLTKTMDHLAVQDKLVLLGKVPTFPATGYGYIEPATSPSSGVPSPIVKFHEKPDLATAEGYLEDQRMLWNMGMFAGRAATFASLYAKHAPSIYHAVIAHMEKGEAYEAAEKKSVDFAIMEPSSRTGELVVLPAEDFSWLDVGNIDVFLGIRQKSAAAGDKASPKRLIEENAYGNKVFVEKKGKLVALVGVEGLCIVDRDDVLLISRCSEAEKVKNVVEAMNHDKESFGPYL